MNSLHTAWDTLACRTLTSFQGPGGPSSKSLAGPHAHLAPADLLALGLAVFQGVWRWWRGKLCVWWHCGQPEAVLVGEEVARALPTLAFEEGGRPEVLQTASWRHEGLPSALIPCSCVHQEGVANPEASPGSRARGDGLVLAVHGHRGRRGLTHRTAAHVGSDLLLQQRRHGQRCRACQPVGPVVSLGVVAHLVDVAVGKGQRAEHGEARACQTQVLIVSLLLPFQVQQTVPCPECGHARGAGGLSSRLTVQNQEEATEVARTDPFGAGISSGSRRSWRSRAPGFSRVSSVSWRPWRPGDAILTSPAIWPRLSFAAWPWGASYSRNPHSSFWSSWTWHPRKARDSWAGIQIWRWSGFTSGTWRTSGSSWTWGSR